MRVEFAKEIMKELEKFRSHNANGEEILSLVEDILRYFDNEDGEEYETNQEILRIRELFLGCVVKVQTEVDFSSTKNRELNKVVVRSHVKYY